MRGLAILTVVIGHLVQRNIGGGTSHPLFDLIYSFHMPLFFFICGCAQWLSYSNNECKSLNVMWVMGGVIRKVYTLLLPAVVWSTLVPILFTCDSIILNLSSGYWFLVTLFKISLIYIFIGYLSSRYKRFEVPLIILANVGFIYLFLCKGVMPYIWFYSLGYFAQKYDLGKYLNKWIAAVAFIAFALCSHYFVHDSISTEGWQVWLQMGLSLLAIVFCYHLFQNVNADSFVIKRLTTIGKYTLGIYLAQNYLLDVQFWGIDYSILSNSVLLVLFTGFSIIISYLCISIQKFMETNEVLGFLFYGKK